MIIKGKMVIVEGKENDWRMSLEYMEKKGGFFFHGKTDSSIYKTIILFFNLK